MPLALTDKGFNYVSYYNGAYENADSLPALAATGANAITLPTEYGIDVNQSVIYSDANYSDSLAALGSTIDEAKSLGLSVMVRPLIDFLEPNRIGPNAVDDWRTYFNPSNPAAFFASYKSMILAEAAVAEAHGAASLCIGTEIDQLTGPNYLSYWTDIISAVRQVFSGALTYSADWNDDVSPWAGHNGLTAGTGNLATQVSFWNQLDSVGIDAYPALSDAANPTEAQLVAGWTEVPSDAGSKAVTGNQSLISYFQGVAAQIGKPLVFTEIGYESASDAASEPAGTATHVYDPALQANLYQAFFDAWGGSGNGALTGAYFWNWDPNAAEVGPGNGANFSPQGEPAENVIIANFAAAAEAPPSIAFSSVSFVDTGTPGDGITDNPAVTLSGIVSDASGAVAVEVYDGAVDLGAATIAGGSWSLATNLAQGTHAVFSAKAVDPAGKSAVATNSTSIIVDTTPPAITFTAVAYDDSGTPGDGITKDPAVTLSGSVSDSVGPVAAEVFDGAVDLGAATAAGGTWSLATTLAQGPHAALSVRATDAAGNAATAASPVSVTIDTAAPILVITSPAETSATADQTITGTAVSGGAARLIGAVVTISDNGQAIGTATIDASGAWSAAVTLTDIGGNAIEASATDSAGNAGTSGSVLDTLTTPPTDPTPTDPTPTAPTTQPGSAPSSTTGPLIALDPSVSVTQGKRVTLTGTVSAPAGVSGVEIFAGTKDLGAATLDPDGSFAFTHSFGPGFHPDLNAIATDALGNAAPAPSDFDLTTGIKDAPYASEADLYDSQGNLLGISDFAKDGSLYLGATSTTLANGGTSTLYAGGSYFDPLDYYAYDDMTDATGMLSVETLYNNDGSHSITGDQDGLTLTSIHKDMMTGGGTSETFVFKPHFGHDTITDFHWAGSGHDVLSLSRQDVSSIAAILQQITMQGKDAVIHVTGSDTITLQNVTKAELQAHPSDFRLHG